MKQKLSPSLVLNIFDQLKILSEKKYKFGKLMNQITIKQL